MKRLIELEYRIVAQAARVTMFVQKMYNALFSDRLILDDTSYDFISSNNAHVEKGVKVAKSFLTKDDLIIDAGCGVSPLLLSLQQLGYKNLAGIEYSEQLISLFRRFTTSDVEMYQGDLANPSKQMLELYGKAKLIYSYVPIRDGELYKKYMDTVYNAIPDGAYIVEVGRDIDTTDCPDLRLISAGIYVKDTSPDVVVRP